MSEFPVQASGPRRVLQLIVALFGWALFVYWWWIVFLRVSREEVVFTVIFCTATGVIVTLVTALWSLHNKRLYRRKAPRSQVRNVPETYAKDTLLRSVTFPSDPKRVKTAPSLRIQVRGSDKIYR
jgi:hypothetical protein